LIDDARLDRDHVLIWGPPRGGGNWVRRNAVKDPDALYTLQQDAPQIAATVDAPWARSNVAWWCFATMQPSQRGDDPISQLPT